jgi:hypothetical protein
MKIVGIGEMDLSGAWRGQLDPEDAGIRNAWQNRGFDETIRLPGSLAEHGYGDDPRFDSPWVAQKSKLFPLKDSPFASYLSDEDLKMPCWLQPQKIYVGAAWYQKEVEIPEEWRGKRIVLHLERPHWETRVWVDDAFLSTRQALGTPHVHDLSEALTPGQHRITIRVDNRMIIDVGPNSHSVSDHTQSNWNGIIGELKLSAGDPVWIDDIQVYPNALEKAARVDLTVGGLHENAGNGTLRWEVRHQAKEVVHGEQEVEWNTEEDGVTFAIDLGSDVKLWDEFSPNLYELSVSLGNSKETVTFGLRDLSVEGTRFTINGRHLFIRGTLECAIFPLTGYPPTDVESWRRIVRICKAHGLNHIRLHSWCPPKAAFVAADELGFYYQVECGSWADHGATIGDGKPLDEWLYEEAARITQAYGNHPSFAMMAYGNEPAGEKQEAYLDKWCAHWKKVNPRCLHTSGAGWPKVETSDFHSILEPRIGSGLNSRVNACFPETTTDYSGLVEEHQKPIVSHEIGQWCVYPNFEEIPKYTGILKPKNFEIFRELLAKHHMIDLAHDFLMASGKLQAMLYKEEIESSLRTPGFAGFQLLDLHDFPGQGTALFGILDPFWDSKPYINPEAFRRFCGPSVPLARLTKRVWTKSETFHADIEVAHFGATPILNARPFWKILNDSAEVVVSGELDPRDVPVDNGIQLGRVDVDCKSLRSAERYKLVVGFADSPIQNDWDFWVYPDSIGVKKSEILVVTQLDPVALDTLERGGKVLWLTSETKMKESVELCFSSIFWNTLWFTDNPTQTLGILCNPEHPVFNSFPTDYHSNWQWWELIHGSSAMVLNDAPANLRPLIQPIDDWFKARRLALMFEAKVNGGKLMVSSMDLSNNLETRPVARQMRSSILNYMESESFDPEVEISPDQIIAYTTETGDENEPTR